MNAVQLWQYVCQYVAVGHFCLICKTQLRHSPPACENWWPKREKFGYLFVILLLLWFLFFFFYHLLRKIFTHHLWHTHLKKRRFESKIAGQSCILAVPRFNIIRLSRHRNWWRVFALVFCVACERVFVRFLYKSRNSHTHVHQSITSECIHLTLIVRLLNSKLQNSTKELTHLNERNKNSQSWPNKLFFILFTVLFHLSLKLS